MLEQLQTARKTMAQPAPWSLQWLPITTRLPLLIGGLVVLVITVLTGVSLWNAHSNARMTLIQQGQAMLEVLIAAADDPLYQLDVETLHDLMLGLGASPSSGIIFGQIYDREGRLLADTTTGAVLTSLAPEPLGRRLIDQQKLLIWEQNQLIIGQIIQVGGKPSGAALLGVSTAPVDARLRDLSVEGLVSALAAAILGALLALLVSRSTLTPIRDLASATTRAACGDFTQPVPVAGRDELAQLGQSFNGMLAQLGQLIERERAYQTQLQSLMHVRADAVRAVVHDLNHMAQGTQSALDLWMLQLERAGVAPTQLAEGRARLQQTLNQQRDLLQDMRDGALLESGNLRLQPAPTNLLALLNEAITPLLPRFVVAECQHQIIDPPADLPLAWCDPRRMRRVFYNLLENALRYTSSVRDDGEVVVCLQATEEAVVCQICDNGRGIPPEQIARLGQQFVRLAQGENLPEGMGLGLNFAMGIVQLSHGQLVVTSDGEGRGTTVAVSLPVAPLA